MSASSSLLPMMNPQPPMNVSTGLGIGVSVVIPSFSRPENIPQMLSSLLLATCMQHDRSEVLVVHGSQQSLERAAYIGRETKKLCAGRCDDKKLRHLDLVRLNDKYFVAERFVAAAEHTKNEARVLPPPHFRLHHHLLLPRLTPTHLATQVIVHIDDDVRPHNELLDLMALKVMGEPGFPAYADGAPQPGVYGPQERQCGEHGYGDPNNTDGPAKKWQNVTIPGFPTIVLTKFAATSRRLNRDFVRRMGPDFAELIAHTRGNGEDLLFGMAAQERGSAVGRVQLNTAECRDIVKVRGLAKGDPLKTKCEGFYEINGGWLDPNSDDYKRRQGGGHSAFSDDDRHFAVRGRICYCLAKRKVRRDLVDCVREGWH